MNTEKITSQLDRQEDIVRLQPQFISRFYSDANRLGQHASADANAVALPERWIGSSTLAMPTSRPAGTDTQSAAAGQSQDDAGLSRCPDLENQPLRDILADETSGPRLLGQDRYASHKGSFRVLVKIMDPRQPIPLHVHPSDAFVKANQSIYPDQLFGKDEACHYLQSPKGPCAYSHLGLYEGVDAKTLIAAMRKGTDHVLELCPVAAQHYATGYMVKAGILHRPGTALTLAITQPSDVYALFQADMDHNPLPAQVLHPGFESIEEAAENLIDWEANANPKLLTNSQLLPAPASSLAQQGGTIEWVFPPGASTKFSGLKLTVDTRMNLKINQPMIFFVWKGKGTLANRPIDGQGGPAGNSDEFFIGIAAAKQGLEIVNSGDTPLVAFALFAQAV